MGWGSVKGERETGLARLRARPVPRYRSKRAARGATKSLENPRPAPLTANPLHVGQPREDLATEALSVCQRTLNVAALAEADAVQP